MKFMLHNNNNEGKIVKFFKLFHFQVKSHFAENCSFKAVQYFFFAF